MGAPDSPEASGPEPARPGAETDGAAAPAEDHAPAQDTVPSPAAGVEGAKAPPEDALAEPPPAGSPPDAAAAPPPDPTPPTVPEPAPPPPVVDVREFDWPAVRAAVDVPAVRARMRGVVERMEALLDKAGGPGLLFDADRVDAADRAILVSAPHTTALGPLWIVGDLHGDLLALEASLALIRDHAASEGGGARPRVILLGDLFDDEGFGLEVLLRVFELIVEAPELVCVIAGNHDEALSYDGVRFASSVTPADFSEFLNANLAHEWIERAGKLAVRLFAGAPRALFFPDGLLVSHGGFPLADLHPRLAETGDWNDPACLADFVWARAHPKARKKLPNRFSRGSQFGHEDFAAFCALSAGLGRPVARMARGHDHVEERYAIYPAYHAHPVLTTVALSRRLPREAFGPYVRVPTLARVVEGSLPQVYRLHIPDDIVRGFYPEPENSDPAVGETAEEART